MPTTPECADRRAPANATWPMTPDANIDDRHGWPTCRRRRCRGTLPSSWTATAAGRSGRVAADRGASPRRGQRPPHDRRMCPAGHRAADALLPVERELEAAAPTSSTFLMHLLEQYMIERAVDDHGAEHLGQRDRPPRRNSATARSREMDKTIAMSAANTGMRLCLAINYGGRAELVDAVPPDRRRRPRTAGSIPSDDHRRNDRRAALYGRHARPRSADSHGRRNAGQQFSALADQLCRDLGDRPLLARIRRGRSAPGDSRFCRARQAVWGAGAHINLGLERFGPRGAKDGCKAGQRRLSGDGREVAERDWGERGIVKRLMMQHDTSQRCGSSASVETVQPFRRGKSAFKLNLPLSELASRIASNHNRAYSYIVTSVKLNSATGLFEQHGSAPNFQGDVLTLCTCKHQMRTRLTVDEWQAGTWVAGFTSRCIHERRHWLFYLMKVDAAYDSQSDLWDKLPNKVRQAKAARTHFLGDVFTPKNTGLTGDNRFEPSRYYVHPCHDHRTKKHPTGWHNDINYQHADRAGHPPLLVGRPSLTFIWTEPMLSLPLGYCHCRDYHKWANLQDDLIAQLQEVY